MAAPNKKPYQTFAMVRRSLWSSERFRSLPSDSIRCLYLYFLTCTHLTGSGCFLLKEGYALTDLAMTGATWSPTQCREAKTVLERSGMIQTDHKTAEILITRWWAHNGPSNDSWFNGAQKMCAAIKSEELRQAAEKALEVCWQAYSAAKFPGSASRGESHDKAAQERMDAMRRKL